MTVFHHALRTSILVLGAVTIVLMLATLWQVSHETPAQGLAHLAQEAGQ